MYLQAEMRYMLILRYYGRFFWCVDVQYFWSCSEWCLEKPIKSKLRFLKERLRYEFTPYLEELFILQLQFGWA